jgi:DNA-directed RNA polymerase subunit RPC12/RpoP
MPPALAHLQRATGDGPGSANDHQQHGCCCYRLKDSNRQPCEPVMIHCRHPIISRLARRDSDAISDAPGCLENRRCAATVTRHVMVDPKHAQTYFSLECSICGRRLRALISSIGQRIVCPHCQSELLARCNTADGKPALEGTTLQRAAELLDSLATLT